MKIINECEHDKIWSVADKTFDIACTSNQPDSNEICDACIGVMSNLMTYNNTGMIANGNTPIDINLLPYRYKLMRLKLLELIS